MKHSTPQVYLAYSSSGRGLLCALTYETAGPHVHGWWTGAQAGDFAAAFFKLEDFFSSAPQRFLATRGGDMAGGWVFDYAQSHPRLGEAVPIEDEERQRLEEMQSNFAGEWLFYPDAPGSAAEIDSYRAEGLPLLPVNIKYRRLHKLDRGGHPREYISPNADMNILDYVQEYWPLDYRLP
ncbi:hypothetical protein OTERR_24620 [Oryzomicrobium terrae]|uniref:Uncharacterized protein n=1 Tax=Oryzomicrobium terrae TaxID=1735038 RepID=A0A5C1ECD4_9RHOO|nr:hypothetical protein [Oryzomicrobium terrae]QEL65938.1 hypothetical protein OTERR_24620 [Oryzomicrobium terrae]